MIFALYFPQVWKFWLCFDLNKMKNERQKFRFLTAIEIKLSVEIFNMSYNDFRWLK